MDQRVVAELKSPMLKFFSFPGINKPVLQKSISWPNLSCPTNQLQSAGNVATPFPNFVPNVYYGDLNDLQHEYGVVRTRLVASRWVLSTMWITKTCDLTLAGSTCRSTILFLIGLIGLCKGIFKGAIITSNLKKGI